MGGAAQSVSRRSRSFGGEDGLAEYRGLMPYWIYEKNEVLLIIGRSDQTLVLEVIMDFPSRQFSYDWRINWRIFSIRHDVR